MRATHPLRSFRLWLSALLAVTALPAALAERAASAAEPFPSGAGAPAPADAGTWLAASDGGVFSFGGAPFYGSMGGKRLNQPIVTMAATPSGKGYWLVATDGGVFAFGDAGFFGSTGAIRLNKPIVAMAPTPSGRGYWLIASDGGVFAFGDAGYFGSTGGIKLKAPIVGMAPTVTGNGYWLVASDGGIFTFGDATFLGGAGGTKLKAPIVGMARTPGGRGYWLAASDGGVYSYGGAVFAGAADGLRLNGAVVSMAATPRGFGYWLVGSDGGIFSFGDAGFSGSLGGLRLVAPVVTLAPRPALSRPGEVSIFFYPWYASPATAPRTGWRHWEQNGHTPPADIGANYYPADGLYSSLSPTTLNKQAKQMAASGVDTVVTSWWGRGTDPAHYEDWMLPDLAVAVRSAGLRLAVHLEPYKGRSLTTVAADFAYFRGLGISEVYIYQADSWGNAEDWRPAIATQPEMRFFAESGNLGRMLNGAFADYALTAGFDGIYTYDVVRYGAAEIATTCGAARQRRLLCAPSVGPGFDGRRAGMDHIPVVAPRAGQRYDEMWRAAIPFADVVSITSWNEWHEGTQIEPAKPYCFFSDGYCSIGYEGVYRRTGAAAETAYMDRTAEWAAEFRSLRSAP